MSEKFKPKKVSAELIAGFAVIDSLPTKSKVLVLTPQIAVAIRGTFPDQELFVEASAGGGYRHQTILTPANAHRVLMEILQAKASEIELERQLQEEARNRHRPRAQPDWRTIASHPEAVIREGLVDASLCPKGSITVIPTRAPELTSRTADKSLDEMGL